MMIYFIPCTFEHNTYNYIIFPTTRLDHAPLLGRWYIYSLQPVSNHINITEVYNILSIIVDEIL